MGILDEAIREHLELKRQHGADDSELKQLEDEAFGPPERPGERSAGSACRGADRIHGPAGAAVGETGATRGEAQPEVEPSAEAEAAAGVSPQPASRTSRSRLSPSPRGRADRSPRRTPRSSHRGGAAGGRTRGDPGRRAPERPPTGEPRHERARRRSPTSRPRCTTSRRSSPRPAEGRPRRREDEALDRPRRACRSRRRTTSSTSSDSPTSSTRRSRRRSGRMTRSPRPNRRSTSRRSGLRGSELRACRRSGAPEPVSTRDARAGAQEEAPSPSQRKRSSSPSQRRCRSLPAHEDVLEDTPDFLEESPEDDQLWFEQKPPKDFDFDD